MPTQKFLQNYPKRGDVFIADLNPSYGHEMHKKRPVLIISNNLLNRIFPTVIILPFSSIVPEVLGPELFKINEDIGLTKESVITLHQIRAVDKTRLIKKAGSLSKSKLAEVEEALKLVLDLS